MANPRDLRKRYRALRANLSPQEQRQHAEQAARYLRTSSPYLRYRRIALYLSVNGELDLSPALQMAGRDGKQLFLPVLHQRDQRGLWFSEYRTKDKLVTNRFGIEEPDIRQRRPVPAWSLDLILLPLVAFDSTGARLGMGGGYYDRTLAYMNRRHHWVTPRLIGAAHGCQQAKRLETNHWDIPLDAVLTENGIQYFNSI